MKAWKIIVKHAASHPAAVACCAAMMLSLFAAGLHGEDDIIVDAASKKSGEPATRPQLLVLDQHMDQMFFQGRGSVDRLRQQRLDRLLLEVSVLDGVCGLSARQRSKCEVAARLDTERAMDDLEAVRRRYGGRTVDMQTPAGREEWQRFNRDGQAALAKLQDVGVGTGLLARVIGGMLDDTQRSAWRLESDLREQSWWRTVVDAGMSQLDVALGLTSVQHDAIRTLLMEKPPRINHAKIWTQVRMHGNGSHDIPFVCRYGLAQLDQGKLTSLLSARQRKTLGPFIEQGKAMAAHLKQQQLILE